MSAEWVVDHKITHHDNAYLSPSECAGHKSQWFSFKTNLKRRLDSLPTQWCSLKNQVWELLSYRHSQKRATLLSKLEKNINMGNREGIWLSMGDLANIREDILKNPIEKHKNVPLENLVSRACSFLFCQQARVFHQNASTAQNASTTQNASTEQNASTTQNTFTEQDAAKQLTAKKLLTAKSLGTFSNDEIERLRKLDPFLDYFGWKVDQGSIQTLGKQRHRLYQKKAVSRLQEFICNQDKAKPSNATVWSEKIGFFHALMEEVEMAAQTRYAFGLNGGKTRETALKTEIVAIVDRAMRPLTSSWSKDDWVNAYHDKAALHSAFSHLTMKLPSSSLLKNANQLLQKIEKKSLKRIKQADPLFFKDFNRDRQRENLRSVDPILKKEITHYFFKGHDIHQAKLSWGMEKYNNLHRYLEKKCFYPETDAKKNKFSLDGFEFEVSKEFYNDHHRGHSFSVQEVNVQGACVSLVGNQHGYDSCIKSAETCTSAEKNTLNALYQLALKRNIKFSGETDTQRIATLAKRDLKVLTTYISQMPISNVFGELLTPDASGNIIPPFFTLPNKLFWMGGGKTRDHTTIGLLSNGAYAVEKSFLRNISPDDPSNFIFIDANGNLVEFKDNPLDEKSFMSYKWANSVAPNPNSNRYSVTAITPLDIRYKAAFKKPENLFSNFKFWLNEWLKSFRKALTHVF